MTTRIANSGGIREIEKVAAIGLMLENVKEGSRYWEAQLKP